MHLLMIKFCVLSTADTNLVFVAALVATGCKCGLRNLVETSLRRHKACNHIT